MSDEAKTAEEWARGFVRIVDIVRDGEREWHVVELCAGLYPIRLRFESTLGFDMRAAVTALVRAAQSAARLAALEEAARVCEARSRVGVGTDRPARLIALLDCADAIRALAKDTMTEARNGAGENG